MTGRTDKNSRAVSVIIAAHGRPEELRVSLRALRQQVHRPLEMIVIDDGSPEPLEALVHEEWPDAVVIRNGASLGAHVSRSMAMERATGTYILTLDDDSNPAAPDVIARAVAEFERDQRLGVLAFLIDEAKEPAATPSLIQRRYVHDFVNCGQMMRTAVAREIGGYRDFYYYYAEETDYAWRVLDRNWRILYAPELVVRHRRSPVGRRRGRIVGYRLRNTLWTIVLNVPFPRVLTALPLKVAGGLLEMARLPEWRWGLWALLSFVRGIPRVLRDRRPVSMDTVRRVDALKYRWISAPVECESADRVTLGERLRWYRRIWPDRQRFASAARSQQEDTGLHVFSIRPEDANQRRLKR